MPDEVTGGGAFRAADQPDGPDGPGVPVPFWRAAPTRLAVPGGPVARSRRWLMVGGVVVAGLLAGASVALASTASAPPAPVHAVPASPSAAPTSPAAPSSGSGQVVPATG